MTTREFGVPPEARDSNGYNAERTPLRPTEVVGIVAVWAFFAVLTIATASLDPRGGGPRPGPHIPGMATRLFVNPAAWAMVTIVGLWLTTRFPIAGRTWRRRVVLLLLAGVLVANLSDLGSDAAWDAIMRPTIARDSQGRRPTRFAPGPRNFTWLDDLAVYIAALGMGAARGYVLRNRARRDAARAREAGLRTESAHHEARAAELHAQLADARLEALRRQLDPHFLFNTLHSISALVERDPRGVRRMVGQLSDLLRRSMDDTAAPEIPLREELALLELYVDIMRIRFGDELTVEMHIDPQALDAMVPNMLLQPLVENAIKHGVEQRAQGGLVEISAALDGSWLVLRVLDNGEGTPPKRWSMPGSPPGDADGARLGVGLRNTTARLAQLHGAEYRFTLEPSANGGTTVEVRLPYGAPARSAALDRSVPAMATPVRSLDARGELPDVG